MAHFQRNPKNIFWAIPLVLLLCWGMESADAQVGIRAAVPGAVEAKKEVAKDANADLAEQRFPGGASLKTDPELQRLVVRSEQFVKEQRFDLACVLWQKVLDEAGDSLMTRDGRLYSSVRDDVERTLAKLPKLGLMTYRISADGEAQAVLSRGEADEEKALGEVIRRYFLSSLGDDAAFKLGCYALDRHDFVSAARLFEKVLKQYPDPSVPRSELLIRYALASSRLGDRKAAELALQELKKGAGPKVNSEVLTFVSQEMEQTARIEDLPETELSWKMHLGNPQRTGRMPPLPASVTSKTLSELWVQDFPMNVNTRTPQNPNTVMMMGGFMGGRAMATGGPNNKQVNTAPTREQIVSQWRQSGWMPTSQLLFDSGRVFYKTCDGLESFDQQVPHALKSRALWRNDYEIDGLSWTMMMYSMNYNMALNTNDGRPRSAHDVLLFGDRVHAQMSISDGLVYSIEGRQTNSTAPSMPQPIRPFQWGAAPRRSRRNWLSCYEVKSGKLRWHRPAGEDDKEGAASDIGFLAAPVPFAETLLAPVTEGGTIWLYAMSREDGRNLWKAYLCDEPVGSCSPWAPAAIAIDGSDAYVLAGTGVVFAVDAASGSVHWAVRYERDIKNKNSQLGMQIGVNNFPQELNGWSEDTLVVHGRSLICMASDSDKLIGLDRRTGELLWHSKRTSILSGSASYCLGVTDRGLIVGGKDNVRRYDIPTGKLVWDKILDPSFGRGAVTADSVYVPVKDSILVLDAVTGDERSQVGVKLTTNDPVGNLYVDGEKIWVASPGRLITLTNYEIRLQTLEKLIAAGDHVAQLNRMRLYAKSDRLAEAIEDLLAVYQKLQKSGSEEDAQQTLLDAIAELRLPHLNPQLALGVMQRVYVAAHPPVSPAHLARRREIIAVALNGIRNAKGKQSVSAILPIIPLLDQDYSQATASVALLSIATPEDKAELLQQLDQNDITGKIVVQSAVAKIDPAAFRERANSMLQAADLRLKMATARNLLNLGERSALQEFVKMLDADDPRIRLRAHQSLRTVTGQTLPFNAHEQPANRQPMADAWNKWVTENINSAKLKLPLPETDLPLGRMLIAFRGLLVELDESHNERWTKQINNVFVCQGLPNGNRLYGIYGNQAGQSQLLEVSEDGQEVWKSPALPSGPFGMQRLPNGNTLVSCTDTNQVLEISPLGETVWQLQIEGRPMGIHRLENGNTLIALRDAQRVVEVGEDKKVIWEIRNLNGPCSAQRLPNGNTLVAEMYTSRVVEFDSTGKREVWKKDGVNNPRDAKRLPNGNTLIAENVAVQELDPQGKVVWRRNGSNPSCISVY